MSAEFATSEDDRELPGPLARKPIEVVDGIPVFSAPSRYIETYETIARDHLAAMKPGRENPWIPDDLWRELEDSTKSLIKEFVREGQRILDVGVGLGRIMSQFLNLDRHGIDISIEYLKVARKAGIDAIFSRIEDMPYKDHSFDIVVTCDVLEHVLDLHRCCSQIVRVLKPGGILIVRVPNRENLAPYLSPELPYDTVHVRNFDESGLRLLFSRIWGCEFVKSSPAAYYLHGAERLRLRLLRGDNPLLEMLQTDPMRDDPRFELLKRASAAKEEELLEWLRELERKDAQIYAELAPHLIFPLDINVVFRKPERATGAVSATDEIALPERSTDDALADVRRLSTKIRELRGAYDDAKQSWQAEIERLHKVYGEDRENLVAEIARLNTVHTDDRLNLVTEIDRLNSVYGDDRLKLVAEIDRLSMEIARLNTVIEQK